MRLWSNLATSRLACFILSALFTSIVFSLDGGGLPGHRLWLMFSVLTVLWVFFMWLDRFRG